jgi:hypothetical protein
LDTDKWPGEAERWRSILPFVRIQKMLEQTNGQEKLRDREKHITFCENSALQNARASSNFNPAPCTPKHKPPVL